MTKKKKSRKIKATRRSPSDLMAAVGRAHADSADLQVRTLLHELQVHSEEITVQNEQLLKAQHELEQARDRYADLYDFAPIGYVSLDPQGTIAEINIAGATLLGRARRFLIGAAFSSLIAADERDRWREFLARGLFTTDQAVPEIEVTIKSSGRSLRLIARPISPHVGPHEVFTAMLDVTEHRRLEAERQKIHEAERKRTAELAREVAVRLTAEERVKALLDRLVDVQERERRRLAVNLHDQLGQQLTALRLTIDALKNSKPDSAEARERFEVIERIISQLDRDVDFLAWELRPAALDDAGLEPALQEFVRQWSVTQAIDTDFHCALGGGPRLPPEVESHIYRIVQEGLNNVSKHAKAQHVSVLLERRADDLTLIVEDDGRGFDTEAVRRAAKGAGMGLAGIQERAASIGGRVQYESARGHGTTLFVRIPLNVVAPPQVG